MTELEKAETRYIKAHRAAVNSFDPTDDQWAELDAAAAELIVLQLAEVPVSIEVGCEIDTIWYPNCNTEIALP